ncbi:MAG: RagB/SusD family nutrient uptake outer membrane protein [Bacteroidales bacterium]|jgi:hypothetical protein|nr:RagB/SusD family nutrient uptake outer membrane protein [Bacteroidales bacterium]MCI2145732.1 RagB/SusD family nutrient uptake outer membrane protein [Bacteroidales bacterium]
MKKILLHVTALICVVTILSACSDFLKEESRGQVNESVLSTQEGLESALTGAYRGLNSPWSYGICNGTYQQLCSGGDDIYCPTTDANGTQLDRCGVTDSNGSFGSTWNGLYKVVLGANKVINNYENCSGDAATIGVMAGEAYFLRAYAYFILVRLWGEIPLVTTSGYTEEGITMSTASEADVYTLIEDDINKAVEMLGDSRRNGEIGRPDKIVAKALMAEIYLTEAGWPLKKDGYYAKAAAAAKEVLDGSAAQGLSLVKNCSDLYINMEEKDNITTEDLFVIPASTTDYVVFYGAWSEPGEIGGWNILFSEVGFYQNFPDGPRKDATFYTVTDTGLSWENWADKHPSIRKLMKYPQGGKNNVSNCSSVLPAHMLRLSQTALTYAEAKARSDGPDAMAYLWLNKIRTRAGLTEYSGLSTQDFIDKVVQERAWELAGECVRWYDLLRLEMVPESFENKNSEYDPSNLHSSTDSRYTFPLPASETLLNPNL